MPNPTEYTVEYRNVKHPRCEFKTGTLLIILPKTGWTPATGSGEIRGMDKTQTRNHKHSHPSRATETTIIKTRTDKNAENARQQIR